MKHWMMAFILSLCAAGVWTGCGGSRENEEAGSGWTLKQIRVIEGLDVPESMLPDPKRGVVYISNIETSVEGYWDDDGKGFISQMTADGEMKQLRWLDSAPAAPINGPKGMAILGDYLYFTDNTRLLRYNLETGGPPEEVPLPGAQKLNDLSSDGRAVLVTDTGAGKIFSIDKDGRRSESRLPEGVNGVTSYNGRVFAVSWDLHEVYEIDPSGREAPRPFGLSSHFTNLDGIEVLDDGSFIVSDFKGNKVSWIAPDRKTVRTLVEIESPADIGIDRERGLLYVPQFMKNRALIFEPVEEVNGAARK